MHHSKCQACTSSTVCFQLSLATLPALTLQKPKRTGEGQAPNRMLDLVSLDPYCSFLMTLHEPFALLIISNHPSSLASFYVRV